MPLPGRTRMGSILPSDLRTSLGIEPVLLIRGVSVFLSDLLQSDGIHNQRSSWQSPVNPRHPLPRTAFSACGNVKRRQQLVRELVDCLQFKL